jgi:hypothetical protein
MEAAITDRFCFIDSSYAVAVSSAGHYITIDPSEVLASRFANILQELVIPQPILEWLGDAVLASDRTEQAARAQSIKRLQARHEQIQLRIETMYVDKLDRRITQQFYDTQSATFHQQLDDVLRQIQDIQNATPSPVDQAVDLLRLTSQATEFFLQQCAAEQRRLLQTVVAKPLGRTAYWKQLCSNRLRFCVTRTGKVVEKKSRTLGQDAILKFGSSGRTRTYNPSVNSRMLYH